MYGYLCVLEQDSDNYINHLHTYIGMSNQTKETTTTRNERVKNAVKIGLAAAGGVGLLFVYFALVIAQSG